jgi:predicted dehydrogenase
VEAGAIGDVLDLQMEWRYRLTEAQMAAATTARPWLLQPALGGGGLMGGGSH